MSTRKTTLFYAVLIAVTSIVIGMVIASRFDFTPESMAESLSTPPMNESPLDGPIEAQTFRRIAATQTPMVVNIRTESETQESDQLFRGDEFFRRFFGEPPSPRSPEHSFGAGSGFVIDKAGFILTNNHVIKEATKIEIGFFGDDNEMYEAKVVGSDQLTDSALLELIERPSYELPEASFGDSSQMQPGDWVMAIGNPFNLNHTVTVGIVSATGRPFVVAPGRSQNVIQTDAAINPGNSGGPLLNLRGEVVGINTAIVSDRASNLGIGFAIPSNVVVELLPQLHGGKVTRGWFGVGIEDVQREAVEEFGLEGQMGAVVSSVTRGAPADKAGVQPGDVIIEYNGQSVENTSDLVQKVISTRPGTEVPVTLMRLGEPITINVTIEELDLDSENRTTRTAVEDLDTGFGMTLQDLTPETARRLGVSPDTQGAVVSNLDPGGTARQGGVQLGDVIIRVNRTRVANATEATQELRLVESGRVALLLVVRQDIERFLQVTKE